MPIFSLNRTYNARISVLEEKLDSYVDISKQMLSKLEQAVEKISESNSSISQILVRYEGRLEFMSESTESNSEKINKVETTLSKQIEDSKKDIEDIKKARWIWSGILIACSFFLTKLDISNKIFSTPPVNTPDAGHNYPKSR